MTRRVKHRDERGENIVSKLLVDGKQSFLTDRKKIFPLDPSFLNQFRGIFELRGEPSHAGII